MNSSKAKTFRNVVYTSLTKGITLVCIAATSSVVARNLSPQDYGVVGFAGIVIGFLGHFSDVGIGSAVIRRPTLDQQNLRTAFALKMILSSCAFFAAFLIAPLAHHFFEHPATVAVIRILAFEFLLSMIGFMPLVTLVREQNYKALVIPGIIGTIVRCILVVTLIFLGWKYWAVIFADVGANLAGGIAIQVTRRMPIGFDFQWNDAKEYLRFGMPLLGSGILVFLIFNLDNFLVGSWMGSAQLGYYALAFSWGSFICGVLYDTVNNVLLPAFSAIQHDLGAMRRWYLKTLDLVGFASVAANTALLANVHFFLVTFLGKGSNKWLPAASSLEILCVYGIIRALTEPLANCIMVLGRTSVMLRATLLAGALEVLFLALVLRTGRIELVAAVVLFAYGMQVVVYLPFLRRNLRVGSRDLIAQLWPVIPAMVGGYMITSLLPASFGGTLITLIGRAVFTVVVTALIHGLCTGFRCFQEASGMIVQNLSRVRA